MNHRRSRGLHLLFSVTALGLLVVAAGSIRPASEGSRRTTSSRAVGAPSVHLPSPSSTAPAGPPSTAPTEAAMPVVAESSRRARALEALRTRAGEMSVLRGADGEVCLLQGDLARPSILDPVEAAAVFLRETMAIWGLGSVERDLSLDRAASILAPHAEGSRMILFRQVVSGVSLFGRDLAVHIQQDGRVTAVTADIDARSVGESIDPRPRLSAEEAVLRASREAGLTLDQATEATLGVTRRDGALRLAWAVQAVSMSEGFARLYVIDARDGSVLTVSESTRCVLHPATARGVTALGNRVTDLKVVRQDASAPRTPFPLRGLYLQDWSRRILGGAPIITTRNARGRDIDAFEARPGASRIVSASISPAFTDGPAVSAHRNVGKVLDYWRERFMGSAYVAMGVPVVHVGVHGTILRSPSNAAALGRNAILCGDGDGVDYRSFTSLEVMAHEFTHLAFEAAGYHVLGEDLRGDGAVIHRGVEEHVCDAFALFVERDRRSESVEFGRANAADAIWTKMDEEALRPELRLAIDAPAEFDHVREGGRFVDPHQRSRVLDKWLFLWINGGTHPQSGVRVDGIRAALGSEAEAFRLAEEVYHTLLVRRFMGGVSGDPTFAQFRGVVEAAIGELPGFAARSVLLREAGRAFEAVGIHALKAEIEGGLGVDEPRLHPVVAGGQTTVIIRVTNQTLHPIENSALILTAVDPNPGFEILPSQQPIFFLAPGQGIGFEVLIDASAVPPGLGMRIRADALTHAVPAGSVTADFRVETTAGGPELNGSLTLNRVFDGPDAGDDVSHDEEVTVRFLYFNGQPADEPQEGVTVHVSSFSGIQVERREIEVGRVEGTAQALVTVRFRVPPRGTLDSPRVGFDGPFAGLHLLVRDARGQAMEREFVFRVIDP